MSCKMSVPPESRSPVQAERLRDHPIAIAAVEAASNAAASPRLMAAMKLMIVAAVGRVVHRPPRRPIAGGPVGAIVRRIEV